MRVPKTNTGTTERPAWEPDESAVPESLRAAVQGYRYSASHDDYTVTLSGTNQCTAHLNDCPDVDPTGATDTGAAINACLIDLAAEGYTQVYCDPGSVYLIGTTVDVPAYMTIRGPSGLQQGAAANQIAEFRAAGDDVTIMRLAGQYSRVDGLRFNVNRHAGVVGIRPNRHLQVIERCLFSRGSPTSTGIRGGGVLYLAVRDCAWSDGFWGRGIDLLTQYADNPDRVYYGVNVGWFERLVFGSAGTGAIRAEGIFTIRDCDFEVAATGPVIHVAIERANSIATIEANYFELSATPSQAILLDTAATATIRDNVIFGRAQVDEGSYGVRLDGYSYGLDITGNEFNRLESGIILTNRVTQSNDPSAVIVANQYRHVTTPITDVRTRQTANALGGRMMITSPDYGFTFLQGAINSGLMYYDTTIGGDTIDLGRANVFHLAHDEPVDLAVVNATAGMQFVIYSQTGNITLPFVTFKTHEGETVTPDAETSRRFFVDWHGVIREA